MRLLYITNGITGSGGLERVLSVKASMLAEDFGHEVHILSLNETGKSPFFTFSDKIIRHSVSVAGNPLQYVVRYAKGIYTKVRELKPDVISVCDDGLKGFFIPRIICKSCPVIYERHVSKQIENQNGNRTLLNAKYRLMNILANDFERFVVLTDGNKNEWPLKNVVVIPNPLPFFPEVSSDLTARKIIAVGKHSYQKAYDLLLTSWSLIKYKSDWELHIYGKKDPIIDLEALAERLAVSESVFFHEPNINIGESYEKSSIFVLSSRFEGFGMVIIEAMAYGLPVVSFDCPYGPGDIIDNGHDGYLIPSGNTVLFAEKLQALMKSKDLRCQFGNNGKASVHRYKTEKIVRIWDDMFTDLINSKKK